MPINDSQKGFAYLHNVCARYPACKGCPLAGGVPVVMSGSNVYCETGRNKKEESRVGDEL